jgi:NodT family efflux transporter outer membrane factor (OMF) lipoprotein
MRRNAIHTPAAIFLGLSLLAASGCASRRVKYQAPVAPQLAAAEKWNTPLAGGVAGKAADDQTLSHWWATLGDPVLTSLEERAVKGNLDLRKAEAKVRQARAQREAIKTERTPAVTASASATGSRSSGRAGSGEYGQSYSTGLDASWEPDFFERIGNSIAAYTADIGAAQEDLRDVLVSLTAEVALNYVDVRSYQAQLAITKSNLESQQGTYDLTVARYQSGLATELDVQQARLTVESTRAGIPTLETGLQKAANSIAVLIGERPGAVDADLAAVKPVPVIPVEIAVGMPADLLRRRPDIRSSERQVAAQTARVGVATADLYPSFTLSGSLGLNSLTILNLFTPAALASTLAGSVEHTVFNRRRIREQIKVQDAVLDQNLAAYESTVLGALQDVEDALNAFAKEQVRRKSLAEATAAAEHAATMSRDLYAAGLKDFLTVLDSQRSLLTLQNQLAQCDATITADLIRLYKALGGGWS